MDLHLTARILLCFLAGSVPFAVVAMWGTGVDITQVGSRNPGFNNVLRVSTKKRALVALVGDLFKGTAALAVLARPGDTAAVLWGMGLAAVVGHCFTPWLRFRGGKGVATTTGVFLYLQPWITLACSPSYFLVRFLGRKLGWKQEGAIASLIMLGLMAGGIAGLRGWEAGACAGAAFVFVVLRHTSNLREVFFGKKAQAAGT
jgi:glycerol-3-phosphate acyltransferase PlsY